MMTIRERLGTWDWDDTWMAVILLLVLLLVLLIATSFVADKRTVGYYLKQRCVMRQIDWAEDSLVFCSDEPKMLLEVYEKLRGEQKK